MRGENGFGFTLRGDSPVLIAGVIPGGCASVSTPGSSCLHGDAGIEMSEDALRGIGVVLGLHTQLTTALVC